MKSIDFAIIHVESADVNHPDGNDNAMGDAGQAFGPMQIWQVVCTDVNHRYGTSFQAADMLGHRSLSLAVFWLYMSIYATSAQLGRTVTDEDRARIWNGGPMAWNPAYAQHAATDGYWARVKAAMAT